MILSLLLIMPIGIALNYLKYDFKIPLIFAIWFFNNLCFVCLSEEIIFRGFLLNQLKLIINPNFNIHIILASITFGICHYNAGFVLVILSTILGMFCGLCYQRTKQIIYPVLLHFLVNLIHIIFFTYPMV